MTTVLIVDDHDGFRTQARQMLEGAGFDVVGEAGDGASALEAAARLLPDAVLLDVQLPDTTGFDVSATLSASARPPTVVLVSTRDAADYGRRIDGCGAAGFIAKAELTGASLASLLGVGR